MRILIVDDDGTNRMILTAMLEQDDHTVFSAENGQQAIQVYDENLPDIVLLDVLMPVMDGYETAKQIKKRSGNQFVPIIFLTAMNDDQSLVKCIESGGDDFLTKPYNRVLLQAKIHALERIQTLYSQNSEQQVILEDYRDRMQRDQLVAEKIFSNLMNRGEVDSRIIHSLHIPADTFNGDIILSFRRPGGGINLLVGDFTGHGLGAAIGALPAAEVFCGMSSKGYSIKEIVIEINTRLKALLPTGMFFAACLAEVDEKEHRIKLWNGGLPDAYIYCKSKAKIIHTVLSSSLPLGVVNSDKLDLTQYSCQVEPGDSVIMHTDGVIETDNPQGEMYGTERFISLIEKNISKGNFIESVITTVNNFRDSEPQRDDLTVMHFVFDWNILSTVDRSVRSYTRKKVSSNWGFELSLEHNTLRNIDPLPIIMQILIDIQGLESHKGNLFMIISELIVNSIDHGLLDLSSDIKDSPQGFDLYYHERTKRLENLTTGRIKVDVNNISQKIGGKIVIKIEDSGKGYDFVNNTDSLLEMNANAGRGIALIKKLASNFQIQEPGNIVEVTYDWD